MELFEDVCHTSLCPEGNILVTSNMASPDGMLLAPDGKATR